MADLPDNVSDWVPVYQIERTDPVEGGLDGIDNRQARALLARDNFLRDTDVQQGMLIQQNADDILASKDALASAIGATLVGYELPSSGAVPRDVSGKMSEWVSPEDFGAVGDGVTDDTAAMQAAISEIGRAVHLLPGKTYLCGELVPAAGVHLFSHATAGYTTNVAQSRPRIRMIPGARALINVHGKFGFSVTNVVLDGNNRSAPVISSGSSRMVLFGCRVLNGSTGIGGQIPGEPGGGYTDTLHMIRSLVASCGVGIANTIDSFFTATEIANCSTAGLYMQAGANSNTFVGGRIEWTLSGPNIQFAGASGSSVGGWMFVGTLIDRGSVGSIRLAYASRVSFVGCLIHRGNRSNSTASDENCLMYVTNSNAVSFTGCVYSRGADDGGTGNNTPDYVLSVGSGNGPLSLVGGAVVQGSTPFVSAVRNPTNANELIVSGVGNTPDYIRSQISTQVDSTSKRFRSTASQTVAPSGVVPLSLGSRMLVGMYDTRLIEVEVSVRDTGTNVSCAAKLGVQIVRGGGGATIEASLAFATGAAGAIGLGSGTVVSLAVNNVSADGSTFDVEVTNVSAGTVSVRAQAI